MLKHSRETRKQMAWLDSRENTRALEIHARSVTSSPDSLSFFAPEFSLHSPEPWLIGSEIAYREPTRQPLPELVSRAEPSSADFNRTFEDILRRIRQGEFEKVVPMVCEELEFAMPLTRAMFGAQRSAGQYAYGFEMGDEGMAGLTPELLFSVDGNILRTMALAGTGAVGGPSLLEDKKERHEHQLVVEHLSRELARFGRGHRGETIEREFGLLKHLYTPLEFELRELPHFEELVTHLHPTAALGGWPRGPAVRWLERQSFHATRKRFGAPFGWRDGERMLCVVAIRNVQWKGHRLQVSSGCGIVGESQVLREWEELALKRSAIYRSLGVEL